MSNCKKQNLKTFVDDNFIIVKKLEAMNLNQSIVETMRKVKIYMDYNRLKLNASKSKIMLISNKQELKKEFEIQIEDKIIKHSPKLELLGNIMTDVRQVVIPAVRNTVRTLRLTNKYLDRKFKMMYTNATYRSRLLFAIKTWGGADKSLI